MTSLWQNFVVIVFVVAVTNGQEECDVDIAKRQRCGASVVRNEDDCIKYDFCCYDPYIKPNCYIKKATPLLMYIRVFILKDKLKEHLQTQVDQAFSIIQDNVDVKFDLVSNHVKLSALLEAFVSQSTLSDKPQYPKCPLKIPLCMRTKCGGPGSNENPNICFQDPRCCYDPDIAVYRGLFGAGFMDDTPACYHGPTSSYYVKLASQLLPWNVFYQKTIADLFVVTAQNHNYHAICSLTLALSDTSLRSPICGWKGMSEAECKLRDCCYSKKTSECRYPNSRVFSGALNDLNVYPELEAKHQNEAQCPIASNVHEDDEGIFRRIPCNGFKTRTTNFMNRFTEESCPQPACCSRKKVTNKKFRSFFSLAVPTKEKTTPANSCPFFFLPSEGLPDLKDRLQGCCQVHNCYHLKKMRKGGQESRSTLTIDQDLRDHNSYSNFQNNLPQDGAKEEEPLYQLATEYEKVEDDHSVTSDEQVNDEETVTSHDEASMTSSDYDATLEVGNAMWEEWGSWSICSKTCGTGIKTKRRRCISDVTREEIRAVMCDEGDSLEATTCALNKCEPSLWTEWSGWSTCQQGCGHGRQYRLRKCQNRQGIEVSADECLEGLGKQSRPCKGLACAEWSQWGSFMGCNATCRHNGVEVRKRRCLLDGKPTPVCFGSALDTRTCPSPKCSNGIACSSIIGGCKRWKTDWIKIVPCSKTCQGGTLTTWRCEMHGSSCIIGTLEYKTSPCNEDVEC